MAAGMVHSASTPEYMNSTPHHSKLRVTVSLSSPLFVAGGEVTGKMEMECRSDSGVSLGLIMVELFAVQELNSRDHSATSTFLHSRRLYQGPGLPPSNAVYAHPSPGQDPLPQGHLPARRGITTFFFQFSLPLSSPSAVSFASGLARVRYEIRASVSVAHRSEKRVVTGVADADVVQCEDMDGAVSEHVVVGENGKVYVQGRVLGGRLVSGQQACVELHVKNHSPKKTTGLSLTLTRALHLPDSTTSRPPLQLTDTLISQNFRGSEYMVQPGAEGIATLVFDVPNTARVVKGGFREGSADGSLTAALFELRCILAIRIGMGIASKDVLFEIPVQLSHPATLPPDLSVSPLRPISPPNPYFAHGSGSGGSSPAFPYDASPNAYVSPPVTSSPPPHSYASPPLPSSSPYYNPAAVYPPRNFWSPHPPNINLPFFAPAPDLQHHYYFPPPPAVLIPFAHPARPSSVGAQALPPNGLLGVGIAESSGLPGVGSIPHAYTSLQSQYHNHVAPDELMYPRPLPQSEPWSEEQRNSDVAEAEEGKGARASRIAQHLRTSTRARSASPTPHRFPGSAPVPTEVPQTLHNVPWQSPATVYSTTPNNSAAPPVLSPRPIRSPRQSISRIAEPGVGGTARSERVDLLERMVDTPPGDEGRSIAEVLRDLEQDKTLPQPPVPTRKARRENLPRAGDVFSSKPSTDGDGAEDTARPKKSVLRPSPVARRISIEETVTKSHRSVEEAVLLKPATSGLDALEKRLLFEVGTRKPEKPQRPRVLSQPMSAPPASLPGGSVSSSIHSPRTPSLQTQPVLRDSEISEIHIASRHSTERDKPMTSSSGVVVPTGPRMGTQIMRAIGADPARQCSRATSAASEEDKDLLRTRENKTRQHEVLKLRKEAKGRVANWLEAVTVSAEEEQAAVSSGKTSGVGGEHIRNGQPDGMKAPLGKQMVSSSATALPPPQNLSPKTEKRQISKSPIVYPAQETKPPSASDNQTSMDAKQLSPKAEITPVRLPRITSPAPLALSKPPTLPKPPALVSPRLRPTSPKDEPQFPVTGVTQVSGKPSPRIPKLLASPVVLESKYDVRSARGGRGGITTSVAALWTSLANENNDNKPLKPPPNPVAVAHVKRPALLDVGKAKPSPTSTEDSGAKFPVRATAMSENASPPTLEQRPRNLIKSASVPAAIVSSVAKPHLSSSASLARSPLGVPKSKPPSLSPGISETREDSMSRTAPVKGDLAFGQARLRDLIKKYQEGAS